jgi:signal transduction histidine kinase
MTYVEEAQIDLINNNRFYSISIMLIGAVVVYIMLRAQVETVVFTLWIVVILVVDVFRMYAAFSYRIEKNNNRINYKIARRLIFIGTLFSGLCWGSLSVITIPVVDAQGLVFVVLVLTTLTIGATTTLSYRYQFSIIFILLVLVPLMSILPLQGHMVDYNLISIEIMLLLFMLFLFKNIKTFYSSWVHVFQLQEKSHDRENQLLIQRERADSANHAKSVFLANMSHELRTPMHAILGFSSLGCTKVGSASDEKITSYFTRINESGERLLDLLNDLLDLSKLESGRMNFEFSENDLQLTIVNVVDALRPLIQEKRLVIDIEPASVDTTVIYDNDKIKQVVSNILSNAIKFSPEGKSIVVVFSNSTIKLNANKFSTADVPAISVSIQDQGVGVPEDELESVFDEFVQSSKTGSSAGGTGLGLSISKQIIKCHGGLIKADNVTGGGAVFTFSLPYKPLDMTKEPVINL